MLNDNTLSISAHRPVLARSQLSLFHMLGQKILSAQIFHVSRALGNAAELLQDTCTDSEKLRLAILLGCIKLGLRKRSRRFYLASAPMGRLGDDIKSFKDGTQYKDSKLSIRSFMQQEEQRAFFWLSPVNQEGHRTVVAHIPAFVPEPSQEIRSLLPYVNWQQELSYNPEQAFPTDDDPSYDEEPDVTAARQTTPTSAAPLDPAPPMKPIWHQAQESDFLNFIQGSAGPSTNASGPATKEVCHCSCALQGMLFSI